jgi:diketogulonate reductase-like aldo/keto reductase
MAVATMPEAPLPSGETIPVLGQGTWRLGAGGHPQQEEISALRLGIDLGMTLIDTAEMYGDGASERLVGHAIADRRDDAFVVTKVLPHHATHRGTISACRNSLRRLGTDHVDLYLLHWRGPVPLEETLAAFADLVQAGAIRHWGVSNFDTADLGELMSVPGGIAVETDQVLYNLDRRGVEWDLLPLCRRRGIPVMAYSPIAQGRLLGHPVLRAVAERHGATPAQVALAWVIRDEGVTAIPQAGTPEHVRENHGALDVGLTASDLGALDRAFPPPDGPQPLEVL